MNPAHLLLPTAPDASRLASPRAQVRLAYSEVRFPPPVPGEPRRPLEEQVRLAQQAALLQLEAECESAPGSVRCGPAEAAGGSEPTAASPTGALANGSSSPRSAGERRVQASRAAADRAARRVQALRDAYEGVGAGRVGELGGEPPKGAGTWTGGAEARIALRLALDAARRAHAALKRKAEGEARQDRARRKPRGERRPRGPYHYNGLRAAVLRLARERLRLGGPEAITVVGLARELQVSPAAIYNYFRSRADLVASVAAEVEEEAEPGLRRQEPEPMEAGLLATARVWLDLAKRERGAYRLLAGESGAGSSPYKARVPELTAFRAAQVLAGGEAARRTYASGLPAPEKPDRSGLRWGTPEWAVLAAKEREWELSEVMRDRGEFAPVNEAQRRGAWVFSAAVHGLVQGYAAGLIAEAQAEETLAELASVLARAHGG